MKPLDLSTKLTYNSVTNIEHNKFKVSPNEIKKTQVKQIVPISKDKCEWIEEINHFKAYSNLHAFLYDKRKSLFLVLPLHGYRVKIIADTG